MMQKKLVLFDFDGTLADTAPDLALAANRQRERRGLPPIALDELRSYASYGARGLIKAALGMETDHKDFPHVRAQFLKDYEANMFTHTRLFEGMEALLNTIQNHDLEWGIVTNKAEYLARPLAEHLGIMTHCATLVGGDTTGHLKPNPASLLYASKDTNIAPAHCIYIGDDERDILAGKAAGMATVVAAYGYCGPETATIRGWQADAIVDSPAAIWPVLEQWAANIGKQ